MYVPLNYIFLPLNYIFLPPADQITCGAGLIPPSTTGEEDVLETGTTISHSHKTTFPLRITPVTTDPSGPVTHTPSISDPLPPPSVTHPPTSGSALVSAPAPVSHSSGPGPLPPSVTHPPIDSSGAGLVLAPAPFTHPTESLVPSPLSPSVTHPPTDSSGAGLVLAPAPFTPGPLPPPSVTHPPTDSSGPGPGLVPPSIPPLLVPDLPTGPPTNSLTLTDRQVLNSSPASRPFSLSATEDLDSHLFVPRLPDFVDPGT